MNSLVVQQHHQNVQIRIQNLMLKQLLATAGVNFSLHIPYIPDISSVIDISTSSKSNMPHPLTFEELPRNLLPKKDGKNKLVIYKKYLMSLILSVMSNKYKGRHKLILIFFFGLKKILFLCTMNIRFKWNMFLIIITNQKQWEKTITT